MKKTPNNIYDLRLRSFIRGFRAESAALWFLCLYILFEYISPQSMYEVIDILPWGQVAILSAFASVFLTRNKPLGFGAMDILFIAFSVLVIFSVMFAWNIDVSLKYWTTYVSWILMYFCVVSVLTTPNRILLFTIFFILINFKLSQHGARAFTMRGFSFSAHGLTGPPGWFRNSGEYAMQMAIVFSMSTALLLAFREQIQKRLRWWILMLLFPATAALTVIGSSSRGGQLALIVVILVLFLKGRYFVRKAVILYIVVAVGLYFLPEEQIARFDTMGDDKTSQSRLMHWEHALDVIKHNPLGIGYKNWYMYYEVVYQPVRAEQIHNTVLEAFVDLGYLGGVLFLVMLLTAFRMNIKTVKEMRQCDSNEARAIRAIAAGVNLGLLSTFIASLFMSVLFYPPFWLAFALTSAMRHISLYKLKELKIKGQPQN